MANVSKQIRSSRVAWLGATVTYEGFPLALRVRPRADSPARRKSFPYLAIVTHRLAKVRRDGLPEPAYNLGLADLDHCIIQMLGRRGRGVTVLVETFGGERTYYAYTRSLAMASAAFDAIRVMHPEHKLSLRGRVDSRWGFLQRYRKDFPW